MTMLQLLLMLPLLLPLLPLLLSRPPCPASLVVHYHESAYCARPASLMPTRLPLLQLLPLVLRYL